MEKKWEKRGEEEIRKRKKEKNESEREKREGENFIIAIFHYSISANIIFVIINCFGIANSFIIIIMDVIITRLL